MFTREDLQAVPLFRELADEAIDHLIRASADVRLRPGEYVVHEGETRRALFVLIEGGIEVTKFVDGAERVVGPPRGPGQVFGEVPIVLDTPSLVSFRAVDASRVMRIETKDFRAVAAMARRMAAAVEAAALDRVGRA